MTHACPTMHACMPQNKAHQLFPEVATLGLHALDAALDGVLLSLQRMVTASDLVQFLPAREQLPATTSMSAVFHSASTAPTVTFTFGFALK